ncbi:acyl-ACP thioesterase domain-containing protein [Colidextribacter sp. OB.20]|uniref:acyl-[acyl-carrier-protein] thioesterase n=1 Tax=Colidextribacter sp. OB.20 TaxID=2304568 RepID=UPI00191C18D6|nr:acyl-ACP thioesterase domain-containing protein [Colidextribacter sp. OB.20]
MSMLFEYEIRLNGLDVDGRNQCKASALLNHLQNAATLAAEDGGFSRETLIQQYGAFWMLARSWYCLSRPLRYEDRLTIRTWHRGGKGAIMYRDYDILANGQLVGESVSAWVLADVNSRRLMRLSAIPELTGTGGGELCKTMTLAKLRQPGDLHEAERRPMRYSDSDLNGHVNNTRYADFACDAVGMESLPEDRYLAEMQIGYLAECRPGEVLTIQTSGLGDSRFVRGVDDMGKPRFETALYFGETPVE